MSSKFAARRGNKTLVLAILKYIAANPLSDKLTTLPATPNFSSRAVYDAYRYIERHGYVHKSKSSYLLTPRAKALLAESAVWELTLPTPKVWDKKWRLVLFDIPKDRRQRRDIFRLRLKELGLVLYQHSVWVYPYPLEEVVGQVSDFYYITRHVSFITAEKITNEKKFLQHFKLK
jgi:DNA-binding transcriptional regulator PaaX